MNRNDIAQMMEDAAGADWSDWGAQAHFQRFAALVAAAERKVHFHDGMIMFPPGTLIEYKRRIQEAEREACARIADSHGGPKEPMMVGDMEAGAYNTAEAIAADIRARGEA
jgi:hypothetical protein